MGVFPEQDERVVSEQVFPWSILSHGIGKEFDKDTGEASALFASISGVDGLYTPQVIEDGLKQPFEFFTHLKVSMIFLKCREAISRCC